MKTARYSGTPLAKKIGIKSNDFLLVYNSPKPYLDFFHEFPEDVSLLDGKTITLADVIHVFATTKEELQDIFQKAKSRLKKGGMLWISWPKKTSGIYSDLDKFFVMKYGQGNGLVDVKVAAIDDDWSGLKFVYRLKDRK